MQTGEDIQGLRKIVDLTRLISIFILAIHFYLCCYRAFELWGLTADVTDKIIANIAKTGLFTGLWRAKLGALLCLVISLVGTKGRKEEKLKLKPILIGMAVGLLVYMGSVLMLYLPFSITIVASLYLLLTATGYLLILSNGVKLTRLIKNNLEKDIFNNLAETFPQEERLLENEYSVNLPAKYRLKDKVRDSWINFINPFRGMLVAGTPGAGKSYFVIRHIIDQHIRKGFSMFLYDFKFDDLSKIAYNKLLKYRDNYNVKPKFYVINFDDLERTHRCNPLDPDSMEDITDATEASRTIMLGLNRDWIKKQGDFFVESPINFLTAIIWYLRRYEDGKFCTLPHVIELMQADYDKLFAVLHEQDEIRVLINPFISAWQNNAMAQLEGQIASAKIGLARLSSPSLYYVLNGNDFTLDINDPLAPKIVCMGNNPQKLQVYGAVLSLYISRIIKLVNQKDKLKSSLVFDEFPTIYFGGIDRELYKERDIYAFIGKENADEFAAVNGDLYVEALAPFERTLSVFLDKENLPEIIETGHYYYQTINTTDMNLNNLEDLREEMRTLGFKEKLITEMEEKMKTNLPMFTLHDKLPADKGQAELTIHFKQSSGTSEYYYLNRFEVTLTNGKPLEEGQKYMVISPDPEKEGKNLVKKFENTHLAIEFFKSLDGKSELAVGKDAANKVMLANMENGKVNYVAKDFQRTYYAPPISQTFWVQQGKGFSAEQATNLIQGRAVYRDDLLNMGGIPYKAWIMLDTDKPRDKNNNLVTRQFNDPSYGFDLNKALGEYKIKEMDDLKKAEMIETSLRNGNRPLITTEKDGQEVKMRITAAVRYGKLNFTAENGKPEKREQFEKSQGAEMVGSIIDRKLNQQQQQGMSVGR